MRLETPRLLLRELYMDDAEALQEIVSDPRVTRYLPFDPQTLEQTQAYITGAMRDQNAVPRAAYDLAIVVRADVEESGEFSEGIRKVPMAGTTITQDRTSPSPALIHAQDGGVHAPQVAPTVGTMARPARLIGRCGLGVNRPEHKEGMIWYLLHHSQWGKGYAFEAANALLGFAFGTLRLHRVFADCDPRNTASCHVAEKLGMTMEGKLRENYYLKGEWCSAAMYGILEGEWKR